MSQNLGEKVRKRRTSRPEEIEGAARRRAPTVSSRKMGLGWQRCCHECSAKGLGREARHSSDEKEAFLRGRSEAFPAVIDARTRPTASIVEWAGDASKLGRKAAAESLAGRIQPEAARQESRVRLSTDVMYCNSCCYRLRRPFVTVMKPSSSTIGSAACLPVSISMGSSLALVSACISRSPSESSSEPSTEPSIWNS